MRKHERDNIEDGVIILPDEDQEKDLKNLDLHTRYAMPGKIDANDLTGVQYGEILESGVVEHLVDSLAKDTLVSTPHLAQLVTQSREITMERDPALHYPAKLAKLLFGGMPDDGSLASRFKAWNMLYALPTCKTIPKSKFESGYYRNEGPTSDM
jgi:hypothetical protein